MVTTRAHRHPAVVEKGAVQPLTFSNGEDGATGAEIDLCQRSWRTSNLAQLPGKRHRFCNRVNPRRHCEGDRIGCGIAIVNIRAIKLKVTQRAMKAEILNSGRLRLHGDGNDRRRRL